MAYSKRIIRLKACSHSLEQDYIWRLDLITDPKLTGIVYHGHGAIRPESIAMWLKRIFGNTIMFLLVVNVLLRVAYITPVCSLLAKTLQDQGQMLATNDRYRKLVWLYPIEAI